MLLLKKLKSSQPLQNNNIMLFHYMFKQDCGISLLEVRYAINLKLIKPARIKKEPLHHIPTLALWHYGTMALWHYGRKLTISY
jgi:hypothetical protein